MEEDNDLEQVTGSPTAGENGFVHVESVDSAQTDGGSINPVEHLEQDDGVVVTGVDTVQVEPPDVRTTEDVGPEEFVDCPDDLLPGDIRSPVPGNRIRQQPFGDDTEDIQVRATDKEKEILPQDNEEEGSVLLKEVGNLHHQLKALSKQQLLTDGNDAGVSSDQLILESEEGGEKSLSLHEMVDECSKFVEFSLKERTRVENISRELNETLHMKDKEIEDLMVRGSIAQDVGINSEEVSSVEATVDRILYSFATAFGDAQLSDTSVSGKLSHIEKSTSFLLEKYHHFLSGIEMLSTCLAEVNSDFHMQNGIESVFLSVRDELLGLKRKELELADRSSHFEHQCGQLMEQVDKGRETVELLNAEIGRLQGEIEQEKTRYNNTKEKLSMAVTKGKALVQQRDSLKQSVTEKASELERCLTELQEKSSALEAAELRNDELTKTAVLANSLQEALSQRELVLEKCGEILLLSGAAAAELQSSDIIEGVTWLANERSRLAPFALDFQRVTDLLSSLELLQATQFQNMESQVKWLLESYNLAKDQAVMLQDQNNAAREADRAEIDRLTASVFAEAQEKNYLKEEFKDLACKYEQIVKEKEQMVALLLNASEISIDGLEEDFNLHSDMSMVINRCVLKIKEQAIASIESSPIDKEVLDKVQHVLYIRDLESKLYEQIIEEEKSYRLEEKAEINSLQINLQRSEEKASVLREKLSLAVKKGKGLVQERENMKQVIAEKNAQVEALTLDLQKRESTLSECRDQINMLSNEVKIVAKLESDLLCSKEERGKIEQFLFQSNTMLQQVIEVINGIILPVDIKEPVEKLKWFASYLSECQVGKAQAEQELGDVKDEASILASKLTEALTTLKSLEDALSVSEKNVSHLAEEKKELEISNTSMASELHKEKEKSHVSKAQAEHEVQLLNEEISTLNKRLVDSLTTLKSLEDTLLGSKETITELNEEKRKLEIAKSHVEEELHKAIEEASSQTNKFQEIFSGKKSLEEALSLAENKISALMSEKEEAQATKVSAEMELQKVKEESSTHAIKLDEAYRTIKFLEDAMSQLKTNVSHFSQENEKVLDGRTVLESELKKLKEEVENYEHKVVDAFATNKTLEEKLFKMENIVSDLVVEKKNAELEISALSAELSTCRKELATKHDRWASELSVFFGNLQVFLKDGSLLSLFKQSFEKKIESLKEIDRLLKDMNNNFDSELLQDYPAIEEISHSAFLPAGFDNDQNSGVIDDEFNAADIDGIGSYAGKMLDNLNTRNQILSNQFGSFSTLIDNMIASLLRKLVSIRNMPNTVAGLQEEVEKIKSMYYKAKEENDAFHRRVHKLEAELEASGNMCNEIMSELEDYRAKEEKWNEIEGWHHEGETIYDLLSDSQIKALFDKIDGITIPFPNLLVGDIQPHNSDPVKKLFYVVDSVNKLQDQITLLSHAKEELHSTASKQALEIEQLKREFKEVMKDKQDSEKMGRELFELSIVLQSIIQKLGGDEFAGVKKTADVTVLLPILERLVQGVVLDSENSRVKTQDMGSKLLESQKVVEESASKVKLLEDFIQNRKGAPDMIQERGVFESSSLPARSEISEIDDQVPVGKAGLPLVPSAPHVRSLRKGSSDQLAISIDSDSDRLLDKTETVEDKGHIFKSLHTSGLVPVKGKMIADRLDGIWVSGGQALMRRPRARLGLIAYWLFLHLWLLGTIL